MEQMSRRHMVQGLAAVVGGAGVGSAALAAAATAAAGGAVAVARSGATHEWMSLRLEDLRHAGEPVAAAAGRQALVLATAVRDGSDEVVERFHGLLTALDGGGRRADPDAPATVETHTLTLGDGTITGQGVTNHSGAGSYAVTGGTGRYHGASGSYTGSRALQGPSGSAQLHFSLIFPEVPHDGR